MFVRLLILFTSLLITSFLQAESLAVRSLLERCPQAFTSKDERIEVSTAASAISKFLVNELPAVQSILKEKIPSDLGRLESRAKTEESLRKKLQRLGSAVTIEQIDGAIRDGLGFRIILKNASREEVMKLLKAIKELVDEGKIAITEIENYFGKHSLAYASNSEIQFLADLIPDTIAGSYKRTNGYTTLQMNISIDGLIIELQIRGEIVHEVSELEHVIYDLKKGKSSLLVSDIQAAQIIQNLHVLKEQGLEDLYDDYWVNVFTWARGEELGLVTNQVPDLPQELKDLGLTNLSMDYLASIVDTDSTRLILPKLLIEH